VKRAMDIVLSWLLIVLFAPAMLVIAALVAAGDGASAVFTQTRIGLRGSPFTMYKFRRCSPPRLPTPEAPTIHRTKRITGSGRWLRRTSLDELPQLINVLRGDMSLVGPRPEMPFIVAQYEPWQRRRLDVQTRHHRALAGPRRKDLPLSDNIEYDFYYIRNWSIWLDSRSSSRPSPS